MTAIARPEHSHKPHKCVSRHAAHATLHTIHSHLSSRLSALSHTFPGTQMSLPLSQSGRAEGMPTQAACFAPVQKRKSPGGGCLRGSRGGGYLLFHFRSIIGVARFNFSVRNGKRWSPCAIATLVSFHSSQICDGVWGRKSYRKRIRRYVGPTHIHLPLGIFAYERYVVRAADSAGDDRSAWGGLASRKGFG